MHFFKFPLQAVRLEKIYFQIKCHLSFWKQNILSNTDMLSHHLPENISKCLTVLYLNNRAICKSISVLISFLQGTKIEYSWWSSKVVQGVLIHREGRLVGFYYPVSIHDGILCILSRLARKKREIHNQTLLRRFKSSYAYWHLTVLVLTT